MRSGEDALDRAREVMVAAGVQAVAKERIRVIEGVGPDRPLARVRSKCGRVGEERQGAEMLTDLIEHLAPPGAVSRPLRTTSLRPPSWFRR